MKFFQLGGFFLCQGIKQSQGQILRRAIAGCDDDQDEDVPQTYQTNLPHRNNPAAMNLLENRSMNQDDVFNNKQGIQSSMNPVENLSGGRALVLRSCLKIIVAALQWHQVQENPIPRSILGYPTYDRQSINVERSKDGNSEQTRSDLVGTKNKESNMFAVYGKPCSQVKFRVSHLCQAQRLHCLTQD